MENQRIIKGIITEYNSSRGFGFITEIGENTSYFFHISSLEKPITIIPDKTEVIFKAKETQKGLQAVEIREYFEKIEGEFAKTKLPNDFVWKTNAEQLEYLEQQQKIIYQFLNTLKNFGIHTKESPNGWISLDLYEMIELNNPVVEGGFCEKIPNGYPKTFKYLIRLLEEQINNFNYSLLKAKKGIDGEQRTLNSLKAITVSYPILNNVRLEEDIKNSNEKYSAETDLIAITDRAVFLIETKNYGNRGDELTITSDGRWLLKNKNTKKEKTLQNPFKQITDHIFIINKFFENNKISFSLPIIPIIALANDELILQIEDNETLYAKVMSADLVGSYILNYHNSNKAIIKAKDIETIKKVLDDKSLPPKTYKVTDYCKNILEICKIIEKLIKYYEHDEAIYEKQENERAYEEELKRKKEQRTENILQGIGTAIALVSQFLDNL